MYVGHPTLREAMSIVQAPVTDVGKCCSDLGGGSLRRVCSTVKAVKALKAGRWAYKKLAELRSDQLASVNVDE